MDQRVYPHEKDALKQATEAELDALSNHKQLFNYDDRLFELDLLTDEIRFSRYWIERMKKDREASDEALGRSLKRESALSMLINEILGELQCARETQRSVDIYGLIGKIDDVVNGGIPE